MESKQSCIPQPTHGMGRVMASALKAAWALCSLPCRLLRMLFRINRPMLILISLAGAVQHATYFELEVASSYPAWWDCKTLISANQVSLVVLVLAAITVLGCVSERFAKALTHQRFVATMATITARLHGEVTSSESCSSP